MVGELEPYRQAPAKSKSGGSQPSLRLLRAEETVEALATRQDFFRIGRQLHIPGTILGGAWLSLGRRFNHEIHLRHGLVPENSAQWYAEHYASAEFPVEFRQYPALSEYGHWGEVDIKKHVSGLVLGSLATYLEMIDTATEQHHGDARAGLNTVAGGMGVSLPMVHLWRAVVAEVQA